MGQARWLAFRADRRERGSALPMADILGPPFGWSLVLAGDCLGLVASSLGFCGRLFALRCRCFFGMASLSAFYRTGSSRPHFPWGFPGVQVPCSSPVLVLPFPYPPRPFLAVFRLFPFLGLGLVPGQGVWISAGRCR